MMKPLLIVLTSLVMLSACADKSISSAESDVFIITKPNLAGMIGYASSVREELAKEAEQFAKKRGKFAHAVSFEEVLNASGRFGTIEYKFRLVDEPIVKDMEKTSAAKNWDAVSEQATSDGIALRPDSIPQAKEQDAVAIIIGIENYKRVPKADFASNDAKVFQRYAIRSLGIPPSKIKLLLDSDADQAGIIKAIRNWLPLHINEGKTQVFLFYSGHGYPSKDGKELYFLPHETDIDLIDETGINQKNILNSIDRLRPLSVTFFVDSCFSGISKSGDSLIAGARPLALASTSFYAPVGFTAITAAGPQQISSASKELRHGIFSYFLMKGMEGNADSNSDGEITSGELTEYVSKNVKRSAMGINRIQDPQLIGDADRVIIAR
jgi:hypothetical protein